MTEPPIATSLHNYLTGLSAESLAKALWKDDAPEEFVKTIPAQSLFLAVKARGLPSSSDIVSVATVEQCRAMIDLDCWTADRFDEARCLEWMALSDSSDHDSDESLRIVQKLLKSIDLRLIGLLVARHVHVITMEEPSEQPLTPGYYTPDKGQTWILIKAEDADQHFYIGRLLALLFETSAEVFYQVLASPSVATEAMLEEEAYADRQKRMAALGIPENDICVEVHSPLPLQSAIKDLEGPAATISQDVEAITPLIYQSEIPQNLYSLISHIQNREDIERELSFIMNSAIVRWAVPFHDFKAVMSLSKKVQGAINIGLEVLARAGHGDSFQVYQQLGLKKIYRVGLAHLFHLRKAAMKVSVSRLEQLSQGDAYKHLTLTACRLPFPETPSTLDEPQHSIEPQQRVESQMQAITTLDEIEKLRAVIESEIER